MLLRVRVLAQVSHVLWRLCPIHPRRRGRAAHAVPRRTGLLAGSRQGRAAASPYPPVRDSAQWLILVARDQADLYGHLVRAFSRDDKVQILMDRRKDYSRNPPGMEERLRIHGAAVIRRRAGS